MFPNHPHPGRVFRSGLSVLLVGLSLLPLPTPAAPPAVLPNPAVVATFTRQVQPLLLNRCAAGACHGGPAAHEPRLRRGGVQGRLDRALTLANLESFTAALGPEGEDLLTSLATRHPASAAPGALALDPLSPQERAVLISWISENKPAALTQAAFEAPFETVPRPPVSGSSQPIPPLPQTTTTRPNRFQMLLEAARNPVPLPPPQEPIGIILGRDNPQ
jgi:hypothetical protein